MREKSGDDQLGGGCVEGGEEGGSGHWRVSGRAAYQSLRALLLST